MTFNPSTADNTLIAGVIIPSPNNRPAAIISNADTDRTILFLCCRSSANSANTPPSPSLSALSTQNTYLNATTIISDHITNDIKLNMLVCESSGL